MWKSLKKKKVQVWGYKSGNIKAWNEANSVMDKKLIFMEQLLLMQN